MTRKRLPNRRETTTFEIEHRGHRYAIAFSTFSDGRVGEVFIDPAKRGSELTDIARDAAVITSIALQHGLASRNDPWATLARDADGARPSSPIGAAIDSLRDADALLEPATGS